MFKHAHPDLTTANLAAEIARTAWPEFLRLPRSGERCAISGLSRSALNALILGAHPPVASVCLRKMGAVRGCRLIVTRSLMEFLYRHVEGPDAPGSYETLGARGTKEPTSRPK